MKRIFMSAIALFLILSSCAMSGKSSHKCAASQCCEQSDSPICCTKEKVDFGKAKALDSDDVIEVLSFHTPQRTTACRAIERLTREVVERDFQKELKAGRLSIKSIDISTPAGELLAAEYSVASLSLYINQWLDGKERRNDMTSLALAKAANAPEEFKADLRATIARLFEVL